MSRQNVTVSLDGETFRKARILASLRKTSLNSLLAEQIDILYGKEVEYEVAERRALALLNEGFHLGGRALAARDKRHER